MILPLSHCSCLNSHSLVSLSCSLCSSRSKVLKAIQQKLYFLLRSSEAVLLSRLDKSRFAQISGRLWKIARIFVIWPGFFCDLVHVQSVVELFAKCLLNHKRQQSQKPRFSPGFLPGFCPDFSKNEPR